MKRTLIAALSLGVFLTLSAVAQKPSTPEAQLGAIIHQAEVEGQYEAAIPAYKKFLADNSKDKALAAKAQYRLGLAYEKLGNTEARQAYEQVVRVYGDQPVATDATKRLANLAATMAQRSLTAQLICSESCDNLHSISEDGRFMAFFEGDDLAIRDSVADDVTRPAAARSKGSRDAGDFARAQVPLLSPDGRQVAYTWQTLAGNGDSLSQLKVLANRNDAKARTLISNDTREFGLIYPAAWRPDGKAILVTVIKPDKTWQHAWVSVDDGAVKVVKSLEWRLQGVWGDRPTISPDGKYIAYAALATNPSKAWEVSGVSAAPDPTNEHIYVLAADGTTETELVTGANINESPVWMPDGKSILFVSNRTGNFDLWSVPLSDGKPAGNPVRPVRVKPDIGRVSTIGMTRSGSYYYRTPRTTVRKFSITELDTKATPLPRSGGPEIVGGNPVWSPDGKQIAFTRQTKLDSAADALLVYFVDQGNERLYKPSSASEPTGNPLWLRDGKALLQVWRDTKGDTSLYRIDLKSGEFRQVASIGSSTLLALSREGKTIYLMTKGERAGRATLDRLVAIDLSSGQQKHIANVSGSGSASLSPDGNTFYLKVWEAASRCGDRIVAVNLTTGEQKEVLCLKDPQRIGGFALSANGQTLAIVIFRELERQLYRIEVDGTNYRNLGRLSATSSPPVWALDGTAVIVNGSNSLMRFPANGGNVEVIRTTAYSSYPPDLSPDGSRIAVAVDGDVLPALWALDNVSAFLKTAR